MKSDTRKWSEGEENGPQEYSRSPSERLDHVKSWHGSYVLKSELVWLYLGAG